MFTKRFASGYVYLFFFVGERETGEEVSKTRSGKREREKKGRISNAIVSFNDSKHHATFRAI